MSIKAVMSVVPAGLSQWRSRMGADRWDEMWQGVLHMNPAPSREHQEIEKQLLVWLEMTWARPLGNRVYHQINLALPGQWPGDYRIPDLLLLLPERFSIEKEERFEGPPNAVVEIRSPGDETSDKFEFYAELGVAELWVIDRDSRAVEVHRLESGCYVATTADETGWIMSAETGIELRTTGANQMEIRLRDNLDSTAIMPE